MIEKPIFGQTTGTAEIRAMGCCIFGSCGKIKRRQFFSDAQVVLMVGDFFLPALIGVPVTFQSLLQRLYLQPEALHRCQKEIDDIVGQSRLPKLDDRVK